MGRKITTGHVAIDANPRPTTGQRQADQIAAAKLGGIDALLQVQQTEVILTTLTHHGLHCMNRRVGED